MTERQQRQQDQRQRGVEVLTDRVTGVCDTPIVAVEFLVALGYPERMAAAEALAEAVRTGTGGPEALTEWDEANRPRGRP